MNRFSFFPGAKLMLAAVFSVLLGTGISGLGQERVLGLDVSYWNRGSSSATANGITQTMWNTAYSTPNGNGYTRHYTWVRATRGGTTGLSQTSGTPSPGGSQETLSRRYDDPEFLRTMTRASTAGLFSGPYHYGRPDVEGNTGSDEADHFIEYASAYMRPGYLIPVFDLEDGSGGDTLAQFSIDFSNRLYERMRIRPAMYINGSYSSTLQGATQSRRDQLAKPAAFTPSVVGPTYPMLWNARYVNNSDPESIPIQTSNPKATASTFYGPWDDYGDTQPWAIWQYASTVSIPGINSVDSTVDGNVAQGDIEYVKNFLVPAVWWHDLSGDWGTLTNWNSGQPLSTFNANDLNNPPAPYVPRVGDGQTTPFNSYTNPSPRLPGMAGSGPSSTSGAHDTVILERPSANITVTVSSGTYNIRKLYMRETLNITGGTLAINYDPTYRLNDSSTVLHGGPLSAQFSGPVTLSGGTLNVHTLQVDTNRTLTLAGGTLRLNRINLMPHGSTPAKMVVTGNINLNPRADALATIAKGAGSGSSGLIDLGGASRTLTVSNGTNDIDISLEVPISNGGLTKAGAGTLRLTTANTYASGTTLSAGTLLVNNTTGSGTGTGAVTVNGGVLSGSGIIAGAVTVNSAGTISPGATPNVIGTLTLNSTPTFNGTNFMQINRNGGSPLADKIVRSGGALSYGGRLVVTNVGAALTGGESFTIFSANSYSGAFASTQLPALSSGLNWYLGDLTVNGSIKVNRSPVANLISFTSIPRETLTIPMADLISNDTDADGDVIALTSINLTTTNGVTLLTNSTSIFYSNSVNVADQFTYSISDGRGGSATGIVRITPSADGFFISKPLWNGVSLTLELAGHPGSTYFIERSTNLPVWMTISTNVAPPTGIYDFVDDFNGFAVPPSEAFYRLRWSP